jgi:3'(2'), 5'-bisphosphate nucleotidase
MTPELIELLQPVIDLAEDAGRRILEVYNTDFDVEHKDDRTPLTEADLAAHRSIVAGLSILTPDTPILSEESATIPFDKRSSWKTYWLVDPLDGTREFIKRNGEFTVNIALIHEHEAVLGVIYTPVSGLTYYACKGNGSFKKEPGGEPHPIKVVPEKRNPLMVAGSRSHQGDSLRAFLANTGNHEIINMGSSLKSCLVAEGKVDIYPRLGPTSEWDTAAAQCIVEEAGGQLTDTSMEPLRYNTKDCLLNPYFFVFGDTSLDWSKYL